MKKALLLILSIVLMAGMFSSAALAQDSVSVMAVWGGQELDAFMKMVEPFEKATGIEVQYEGTRDLPTLVTTRLEAGNPPDIVALTGVGMMKQLAEEGDLVNLSNVLDMDRMNKEYSQTWIDLGTYNEDLYGMYISADVKSLVWYNPKEFAAKGYEVPETWDELEALQEEMIANGDTPWSIGLESGAASGWPGTDWIEDIMLRTTDPEVYDQWVNHEIPWTDARVKRAFEIFGEIAKDPEYTYGAPTAVLATNFGDAPNALFTDPPQAMMHRQASFITSFIRDNNPGLVAGEDYDFFPFPEIDEEYGTPVLGAASMFGMMNDTSAARAFMRYVSTAGAQSIFVSELGKLGVNKNINPNVYPDDLTRQMAAMLREAPTFRFDGSDSMPGAVGSGAFWQGILDYVSGQDLDGVLEYIESISQDTYNQ
jgi:alpha-glucoside transport system substrate-binding protein